MDDVYTTAKWANRMLRPLTSLHHRLAKYREMQSVGAQQPETIKTVSTVSISESSRKRHAAADSEHDSECGDNDPSWIPRKPDAKRVRRKYVVRGERHRRQPRFRPVLHSPETVKTLPGAIEIATPLIMGKSTDVTNDKGSKETGLGDHRNEESSRNNTQQKKWPERTGKRQNQARFPKPDPQWRVSLDSAKDINYADIVQRLDIVFLKFLEKTRLADSRSPRSTNNSRSLLLTVMRRLPQFIAEEQKLQDECDADDDIDMADAYFTELESAYGSSGKGWQPLREAVRSQGISLVCNMLQENWITHLTASILIKKCIGAEENDAVERLLGALLLKLDCCDFPDAFDPWRVHQSVRDPVRLLHRYWSMSGNSSFVFAEIERLLRRKVLPSEWMVTTPWKAFVASATKSLSNGDSEYAAATRLITAILETAAGINAYETHSLGTNQHAKTAKRLHAQSTSILQTQFADSNRNRCPVYIHDALSNLISSLVVALCSMYCVRVEQSTNLDLDSSTRIVSIFSNIILALQRELAVGHGSLNSKDDQTKVHLLRKGYLLLGHYLLRCQQEDTQILDCEKVGIVDVSLSKDCEPFFEVLQQNSDIIKELSGMVGQVVRCCERGGEQAQCRRARRLCTHLLTFEQFEMNNLTLFLGQVAVEVALDFAQYSQDAEDHTFAADIQETVSARRMRFKGGRCRALGPEYYNTPFFRWEEGIGEWIAKTPLVRAKIALPKPMVEITTLSSTTMTRSLSSVSEEESRSPSSIGNGSSMTSVAGSPSSVCPKKKNMDIEPPHQRIKRPRKSYDKTRQSTRIATRQSNMLVLIHAEERNRIPCNAKSDYESEYNALERAPEDGDFETERGEISDDEENAKVMKLQSSVARQHQQQRQHKRMNFEVIIHNCAGTPRQTPAHGRRGRGRPRKQVAQQAAQARSQSIVAPRQKPSQQRSIIPCSEDEDSDDELSFL
ncbi:hypothetical protein UA08_04080 [Talaromyces atroroseus]|uniref:Uncharacterized protein n=1 Tax=Talaromyces atroroseus TaxID=1441469 RepID=A0A1Q5Q836_TALAT|nr:hypothetical protein UA08_04080 [Talaromyces atroroseus]OKL60293.1 hypothetical protein UA08_04080 [Talaromyces atroroseus]